MLRNIAVAALLISAPAFAEKYKSEGRWERFNWRTVNLIDLCREGRTSFVIGKVGYDCEAVSDCPNAPGFEEPKGCTGHWKLTQRRLG